MPMLVDPPSHRLFRSAILPLLASLALAGCGTPSGLNDPYEHALAIERELLRQHPAADYSHSTYIPVLKALRRVKRDDRRHAQADAMARRIADGRRFAVAEKYPDLKTLPRRLRGQEKPAPARKKAAKGNADGRLRPPRTTPGARKSVERFKKNRMGTLTAAEREKLDITLYSTTWCGYCRKARRWFTRNDIPFVEKDIEKDAVGRREYKSKAGGYSGVPLLDINGEVQRGFSPIKVEGAIAAAVR